MAATGAAREMAMLLEARVLTTRKEEGGMGEGEEGGSDRVGRKGWKRVIIVLIPPWGRESTRKVAT